MTLAPASPQTSTTGQPSGLAVFYDPLSYAAYDHPYEVYRQLRDHAPVYYNARRDLWVVSRYEDVKACLRNHEQMVNALGNDMDGTHDSYGAGQPHRAGPAAPHACCATWCARRSPPGRSWRWRTTSGSSAASCSPGCASGAAGTSPRTFALPLVFGVGLRLLGAPDVGQRRSGRST